MYIFIYIYVYLYILYIYIYIYIYIIHTLYHYITIYICCKYIIVYIYIYMYLYIYIYIYIYIHPQIFQILFIQKYIFSNKSMESFPFGRSRSTSLPLPSLNLFGIVITLRQDHLITLWKSLIA